MSFSYLLLLIGIGGKNTKKNEMYSYLRCGTVLVGNPRRHDIKDLTSTDPCQFVPQGLQRTTGVLFEPKAAEKVLSDNQREAVSLKMAPSMRLRPSILPKAASTMFSCRLPPRWRHTESSPTAIGRRTMLQESR
jgi:hypothetical protein